jgi:hypothetical protein
VGGCGIETLPTKRQNIQTLYGLASGGHKTALRGAAMSAQETGAALRKAFSLIVDSALAGDDAVNRNDPDNLAKAIEALTANGIALQDLAAAWQVTHA